eukprot:Protomagalhaensia_sp_Gyna_25__4667@NODE_43_length_6376_cov_123_651570_g32_i0_p3_GENE_NODE_43_length_6376_cov_123_651570_g32_i0NODE_43_length_6376_cov_123_651570_g32_i0_p3_ORF_typecomplete_len325_score38_70_NODE_43_length_6376_cov_123_651570_g32_i047375711
MRTRSCTPPSRPGVHARVQAPPRKAEMRDAHLRNLQTRSLIREDRLADLKITLAKELLFINRQIHLVDTLESHAIEWAVTMRDIYLPSTLSMLKGWEAYIPTRQELRTATDKLTRLLEEELDHLVENTNTAAMTLRKLLVEIRGQCHLISEGFKLRDDCFKQLASSKAQSIVIQMMMNEGQWPRGQDVTTEEFQSLESFIVADRTLRENLVVFTASACGRSGAIAARTLHFANLLGAMNAQFKQRLDLAAIRFMDATRESRPLVPCLEMHLQAVPATARPSRSSRELPKEEASVATTTGFTPTFPCSTPPSTPDVVLPPFSSLY